MTTVTTNGFISQIFTQQGVSKPLTVSQGSELIESADAQLLDGLNALFAQDLTKAELEKPYEILHSGINRAKALTEFMQSDIAQKTFKTDNHNPQHFTVVDNEKDIAYSFRVQKNDNASSATDLAFSYSLEKFQIKRAARQVVDVRTDSELSEDTRSSLGAASVDINKAGAITNFKFVSQAKQDHGPYANQVRANGNPLPDHMELRSNQFNLKGEVIYPYVKSSYAQEQKIHITDPSEFFTETRS